MVAFLVPGRNSASGVANGSPTITASYMRRDILHPIRERLEIPRPASMLSGMATLPRCFPRVARPRRWFRINLGTRISRPLCATRTASARIIAALWSARLSGLLDAVTFHRLHRPSPCNRAVLRRTMELNC